jgi:hypothetical protein
MVAGVDYKVGIPDGLTLKDWRNIDGSTGSQPITGVTVSGNNVTCVDNTTIDGVDFALGGAGFLNIGSNTGITVLRSKFLYGTHFFVGVAGSNIMNMNGATNPTFKYCEFDGNGSGNSSTVTATGNTAVSGIVVTVPTPSWVQNNIDLNIFNVTTQLEIFNGPNGDNSSTVTGSTGSTITVSSGAINTITTGDVLIMTGVPHQSSIFGGSIEGSGNVFMYNYYTNFTQHIFEIGSNNPGLVFTQKYCFIYNGGSGGAQAHLNYLQWGSLPADSPNMVVDFNCFCQPQENFSGGEGIQGYCNSGTFEPGGSYGYNTQIQSPTFGAGRPHFVTGKNWNAHNNYCRKGTDVNSSYFDGTGVDANTYANNVDLNDGRVFNFS